MPLLIAVLLVAKVAPGLRFRDLAAPAVCAGVLTAVHYAVALAEGPARGAGGPEVLPLLATDVVVLGRYLRLLYFPLWGQSLVPDVAVRDGLSLARLLPALVVVAAAAAALAVSFRRDRRVFAGLAMALLALAPFNNLFPRTDVLFAERYLYFSLLGAALALAALAARFGSAGRAGLGVAAAGFLVLTLARNGVWADEVSVFRDAAAKAGDSWLAPMKLGDALKMRAASGEVTDPGELRGLLAEAAGEFRRALPRAGTPQEEIRSRVDLAGALLVSGERPEEVLAALDPALPILSRLPAEATGPLTLEVMQNRGAALLMLGRAEEAAEAYRQAAAAAPGSGGPLAGLAAALARGGDLAGAVAAGREAVKADPAAEGAAVALAEALILSGEETEARAVLAAHVARAGGATRARTLLGQLSLAVGRPREAKREFAEVLRAAPGHPDARRGSAEADLMLARGALARGARDEARSLAESAVTADPECAGAIAFLAGLVDDAERAEQLLSFAATLPGGEGARDTLSAHRLAAGVPRLRAGDAAGAAQDAVRALRAAPARLDGGLLEGLTGDLLADLRSFAAGPGAIGREGLLAGLVALSGGDAALAEEQLGGALKAAVDAGGGPAVRLVLLLRGRGRAAAGDLEGAEADLSFAMERDASDWLAPLLLSEARSRRAGGALSRGESADVFLDGAVSAAEAAAARAPERLEPLLRLGEAHFAAGRSIDALRAFSRAKEGWPDRSEPRLDLAAVYKAHFVASEDREALRGALEEVTEALRLEPGNARARAALGEVLLLSGQAKRAAMELSRAVAEDPTLVEARETLAGLYVHSGRSQLEQGGPEAAAKAAESAQLALALGARGAGPHLLLMDARRAERDFARALESLAEAKAREPDSEEVKDGAARYHRDLGYAFLLTRQEAKAMAEFRKAVESGSKNTDLAPVRRLLGMEEGGPEGESPDPEVVAILRERTETARRHFEESGRLLAAGDLEGAEREIRASLEARRTGEGLCRLGEIQLAARREEEAIRSFRLSAEVKPGLAAAHLALGHAHYRRGEMAEAVEAFERWLSTAGEGVSEEAREAIRARVTEMRGKLDAGK
ncbi:MAG: tetratricopeptide repeat protein [Planctomycetes bacterium]|nr:tetratricopeptide repeat protein [Planctomycetota bacterium]